MRRLALALLLALLLLLGRPAAAEPPALKGVQLALTSGGITARWEPPAGQAMVCAIHRGNRAPLEPCYEGGGGQHTFLRSQDLNLQAAAGDEVDLYAYDAQGRIVAWERLPIADHWRTYLPVANSSPGFRNTKTPPVRYRTGGVALCAHLVSAAWAARIRARARRGVLTIPPVAVTHTSFCEAIL